MHLAAGSKSRFTSTSTNTEAVPGTRIRTVITTPIMGTGTERTMNSGTALLLVAAVAAVGVLHTIVPDHWLPITLIARQRGWSTAETAWAACRAGIGHVLSTLLIGVAAWLAGVAAAERFGHLLALVASLALVGFGGWIALSSWAESRRRTPHRHDESHVHSHSHSHPHPHPVFAFAAAAANDPLYLPLRAGVVVSTCHAHRHRHGHSRVHTHWHDHAAGADHPLVTEPVPLHDHRHKTTGRTALLLILGSSPMVEGIPAFFAAARFGPALLGIMAIVFAIGTIATYVLLCSASSAGLQRLGFGAVERYGEVLSGGFIALVGLIFCVWPVL